MVRLTKRTKIGWQNLVLRSFLMSSLALFNCSGSVAAVHWLVAAELKLRFTNVAWLLFWNQGLEETQIEKKRRNGELRGVPEREAEKRREIWWRREMTRGKRVWIRRRRRTRSGGDEKRRFEFGERKPWCCCWVWETGALPYEAIWGGFN